MDPYAEDVVLIGKHLEKIHFQRGVLKYFCLETLGSETTREEVLSWPWVYVYH